ncbi:MAG: histidine--tRNA ligase [Bacillota bacterium]
MSITRPRGTNDILPDDSLKWQYIEDAARDVFARYNYQEIRTPIFESTDLFCRGIGESTDIVEKEMYTFTDKGGRSITLRPEGTASVMRSFLEHKVYGQAQPTKYFYYGPMFRYERPQSGRYRQFHQLGVEVLGADSPAIDAEVIALGLQFLTELGLEDLEVHLNSVGCPECRAEYRDQLRDYFADCLEDLCSDCQSRYDRNPLRILDCKSEDCQSYATDAPEIIDHLCPECDEHFAQVKSYLDQLEIDYIVDANLVRGLDYYTNTAFEIMYTGLGAQDTIFGGGRYNGLAEEIGDREVPGIGFAMGMERIVLALEEQDVELPLSTDMDLFITTIGQAARETAFNYLYQLRQAGLRVEMDYLGRSVKGQMKCADRNNAQYSIILGEDELNKGTATIREMTSGDQTEIELDNLVEEMKRRIA